MFIPACRAKATVWPREEPRTVILRLRHTLRRFCQAMGWGLSNLLESVFILGDVLRHILLAGKRAPRPRRRCSVGCSSKFASWRRTGSPHGKNPGFQHRRGSRTRQRLGLQPLAKLVASMTGIRHSFLHTVALRGCPDRSTIAFRRPEKGNRTRSHRYGEGLYQSCERGPGRHPRNHPGGQRPDHICSLDTSTLHPRHRPIRDSSSCSWSNHVRGVLAGWSTQLPPFGRRCGADAVRCQYRSPLW